MSQTDPFADFRTKSLINLPLPIKSLGDPFREIYNKLTENYPKPHKLHGHFASFHNCLLMCRATWKDLIHVMDEQYMKGIRYDKFGRQPLNSEYDYLMDSYFLVLSRYYTLIFLLKVTTDRALPFLKHIFKHKGSINTESFDKHMKQITGVKLANKVSESLPKGYKQMLKSEMAWYSHLKDLRDKLIAHYSSHYYPKLNFNKQGQMWLCLDFPEAQSDEVIFLPNPLIYMDAFESFMSKLEKLLFSHLKKNNFKIT